MGLESIPEGMPLGEARPEARYKMRELIPRYYMMLGALAAVKESDNEEWAKAYRERLLEIEEDMRRVLNDQLPIDRSEY